ncbi:hypothetical protein D3C83_165200 [compost metagenome]
MNSSLPALHSHRKRKFVLKVSSLELYCVSPLTNMRGVSVYVSRSRATCASKSPSGRSTKFTE